MSSHRQHDRLVIAFLRRLATPETDDAADAIERGDHLLAAIGAKDWAADEEPYAALAQVMNDPRERWCETSAQFRRVPGEVPAQVEACCIECGRPLRTKFVEIGSASTGLIHEHCLRRGMARTARPR